MNEKRPNLKKEDDFLIDLLKLKQDTIGVINKKIITVKRLKKTPKIHDYSYLFKILILMFNIAMFFGLYKLGGVILLSSGLLLSIILMVLIFSFKQLG